MFYKKVCRRLESNHGPLVSEPLPKLRLFGARAPIGHSIFFSQSDRFKQVYRNFTREIFFKESGPAGGVSCSPQDPKVLCSNAREATKNADGKTGSKLPPTKYS